MEVLAFGMFAPEWNAYRSIRKLRRALGLKPAAPDSYFLYKVAVGDNRSVAKGVGAYVKVEDPQELAKMIARVEALACFEKVTISVVSPARSSLPEGITVVPIEKEKVTPDTEPAPAGSEKESE